jgi:hypothetical protein
MMPDEPVRGWWRRNLWGLLLVTPMVLLAMAVPFKNEVYDRWFHLKPISPINGQHGAWVDYAGARVRLLELTPAVVETYGKKTFTVPGAQVWRARAAFDTPNDHTLGGCQVELEDNDGRLFADRPSEITTASLSTDYGCTPPTRISSSPAPSPASGGRLQFENTFYFVLPASAHGVAVRLFLGTKAPKYARLISF